jgi:hypothetical protein
VTSTEPHRLPRKGTPCVLRGEHTRCRDAGHQAQDAKRHRERYATDPEYAARKMARNRQSARRKAIARDRRLIAELEALLDAQLDELRRLTSPGRLATG